MWRAFVCLSRCGHTEWIIAIGCVVMNHFTSVVLWWGWLLLNTFTLCAGTPQCWSCSFHWRVVEYLPLPASVLQISSNWLQSPSAQNQGSSMFSTFNQYRHGNIQKHKLVFIVCSLWMITRIFRERGESSLLSWPSLPFFFFLVMSKRMHPKKHFFFFFSIAKRMLV